jgi:hypothetical protein
MQLPPSNSGTQKSMIDACSADFSCKGSCSSHGSAPLDCCEKILVFNRFQGITSVGVEVQSVSGLPVCCSSYIMVTKYKPEAAAQTLKCVWAYHAFSLSIELFAEDEAERSLSMNFQLENRYSMHIWA